MGGVTFCPQCGENPRPMVESDGGRWMGCYDCYLKRTPRQSIPGKKPAESLAASGGQ